MHQTRITEKGAQIMQKGGRAMKKFLFLGIGSALMFTMGGVGPAHADNIDSPHVSTAGAAGSTYSIASAGATRCASCHRAHTAKAEYLLTVSYTHLRAHETRHDLVCRLLLEKK